MKQEILDFYKGYGIPVHRMVRVGIRRRGLTEKSIREAAETLYGEIQNGLDVEPIRIAWEVYARSSAAKLDASPATIALVNESVTELKAAIEKLAKSFEKYSTPWYKRLWRWLT